MPNIRSPEDSIFTRPGEGIKTTQMYGSCALNGSVAALNIWESPMNETTQLVSLSSSSYRLATRNRRTADG